jgi:hypothetical protein
LQESSLDSDACEDLSESGGSVSSDTDDLETTVANGDDDLDCSRASSDNGDHSEGIEPSASNTDVLSDDDDFAVTDTVYPEFVDNSDCLHAKDISVEQDKECDHPRDLPSKSAELKDIFAQISYALKHLSGTEL